MAADGVKVLDQKFGRGWALYNGDSCEVLKAIPDNSIGFMVFSPPFEDLFVYSASERDLGNSRTSGEFYQHFKYLVAELYRVLAPGRNLSFHVSQVPATMVGDGFIGLRRCKDKMCDVFESVGFITYSETVIWKNPVVEQQRTNALGLLHCQIVKDSARSRSGLHDYLVTMQKPGSNPQPVSGAFDTYYGTDAPPSTTPFTRYDDSRNPFSIEVWQKYASSVWMDIEPGDTLNGEKGKRKARSDKDEKHISPLNLTVIRRALQLYSNPGDIVLSPFAGIGSEGYVSLQMGRRFIGCELKPSYFNEAVENLKVAAGDEVEQLNLFDIASMVA